MSKSFFCIGIAIASTVIGSKLAMAVPLPSGLTSRVESNAPLCYIQFQGSGTIDVSSVCGKIPGQVPDSAPVSRSKTVAPPIFNPKVTNASTTGQCNFVDANGNPCPQK